MSGGVDSAVAAARSVAAGYSVTGVHLALGRGRRAAGGSDTRGCCTPEDARDVRRIADLLGIPCHVWDLSQQFQSEVIEEFIAEYAAGRTPNPCLRCNEKIKFAALLDRAVALGFDAVVTGHHARLGADGILRRSVDLAKDQSYVLAVLTRAQLDRTILPLGESTKAQVRAEAARLGLAVATKPDSTDICFIPDGDTRGYLAQRLGRRPGDIVDAATGAVLGRHDGAYAYTVGQRRGLNLRVAAPDRRPRYVLSVLAGTNTVLVGPAEALDVSVIYAERAVWTGREPGEVSCETQLRAHGETFPAVVQPTADGGIIARLARPARGIATGQAIVAFEKDAVLCSATIVATGPSPSPAAGGQHH